MAATASRADSVGRPPNAEQYADWRTALADQVTDPSELCWLVGLPSSVAAAAARAERDFPLLVPRTFVGRMRAGDPHDPLLLQVLPRPEELADRPEYTTDPVGEATAPPTCGLLQKYRRRVLIVATGACAVHCRFCFRRHFRYPHQPEVPRRWEPAPPNSDRPATSSEVPRRWEPALRQIAADRSIREVILSGGDPLTLDDELLARLARRLAAIAHLRRLRVHTRLPVLIPQRVTDDLLGWLRGARLAPVVVIHVNHPAEIDDRVAAAIGRLVDGGVPVLSQSVLLRGTNDRLEVLARLFERLADLRALPYYLHQLDRVAGAAHFEVPEAQGVKLIGQLRSLLPGYAVPRYVRESPGRPSKHVLA